MRDFILALAGYIGQIGVVLVAVSWLTWAFEPGVEGKAIALMFVSGIIFILCGTTGKVFSQKYQEENHE